MRIADEYDAAQERGEVAGAHEGTMGVPNGNAQKATAADLGLRRRPKSAPQRRSDIPNAPD